MEGTRLKTILIYSPRKITREALRSLLTLSAYPGGSQPAVGMRVVGEAGSPLELRDLVGALRPDVVVIDERTNSPANLPLIQIIRQAHPAAAIVLLSMHAEQRVGAQQAGVDAFLLKGCQAQELFDAILNGRTETEPARQGQVGV